MEQLKQYIKDQKTTGRDFAANIGVSASVVSRYMSGQVRPPLDVAFVIEDVTGGQVPARCWID